MSMISEVLLDHEGGEENATSQDEVIMYKEKAHFQDTYLGTTRLPVLHWRLVRHTKPVSIPAPLANRGFK